MENINKGLLHRAFSAFVFHPKSGKLLLQQRAAEKITFSNMWTNTCCSHPLDDAAEEKIEEEQRGVKVAARRKLEQELGIPQNQTPIDEMQYLTKIHYLAPSTELWGEHEGEGFLRGFDILMEWSPTYGFPLVDYILFICADVTVKPNPNEIRDHRYVSKQELIEMLEAPGNRFTPWFELIARDFLFGWWDELLNRRGADGTLDARSLAGLVDGSKVIKMV